MVTRVAAVIASVGGGVSTRSTLVMVVRVVSVVIVFVTVDRVHGRPSALEQPLDGGGRFSQLPAGVGSARRDGIGDAMTQVVVE